MKENDFPKVISAKVSVQHYEVCRKIAFELHKSGILAKPSVSELMRYMVSQLQEKMPGLQLESGRDA